MTRQEKLQITLEMLQELTGDETPAHLEFNRKQVCYIAREIRISLEIAREIQEQLKEEN